MLILDDVEVELKSGNKKAKQKKKDATQAYSFTDSPSIFPKKFVLRFFVKVALKLVPNIDMEIRHIALKHEDNLVISAEYTRLTVKSSKRANRRIYTVVLNTNNIDWRADALATEPAPISLATFKLQSGLLVNLKTGVLSDFISKVFTDEFRVKAYPLARWIARKRAAKATREPEETQTEGKSHSEKRLVKMINYVYRCTEEISIISENTSLVEIPLLSSDDDYDISSFWNMQGHKTFFNIHIKSLSHTMRKFNKDSAGFHVLFNPLLDSPVQAVTALQILRIEFCRNSSDPDADAHISEILSIPNFALTQKGNLADHFVKGDGFKACAIELFATLINPTLDLDANQLSIMACNFVVLERYLKAKKMNESTTIEDSDLEVTRVESETHNDEPESVKSDKDYTQTKFIALLNEYYPRLNMTLIMEQPRIVLRQADVNHDCQKLVNFSYSLLNFHVVTTKERDYDARCHILRPSVTYQGQTTGINSDEMKREIFKSESFSCRLQLLKSFEIKAAFELSQTILEMDDLQLLAGISSLLDDLRMAVAENLNSSEILKHIRRMEQDSKHKHKSVDTKPSILSRPLPRWLLEVNILLTSFKIVLGSRSLLIPEKEMTRISKDIVNDDKFGDYNRLRSTRFAVGEAHVQLVNCLSSRASLPPQSSSLDTLAEGEELWKLQSKVSDIGMTMDVDNSDPELSVVDIPIITLTLTAIDKSSGLMLQIRSTVDNITVNYDRFKGFILLGTFSLFKLLIASFKAMGETFADDSASHKPHSSNKPSLDFELWVKNLDLTLILSEECTLRTQLFYTKVTISESVQEVNAKLLRVLINSPTAPDFWSRILILDNLNVAINGEAECPIMVRSDFIKFIQPHGLVVYHVFDSISVTIKVIKHLVKCMKSTQKKTRFVEPLESPAKKLPRIKLRAVKLHYHMEDDPFESDINMIFQLGLVEQRKRLEQIALLESTLKRSNELPETLKDTKEHDEMLDILHVQMARSWIRKIKVYRTKLEEGSATNKTFLFGEEAKLDRLWNRKIAPYLIHAPLLNVILLGFDLDLSSVQDLEKLPEMIHSLGQGVPTDTTYSMLLPFYVKLLLEEVRMHLRDYPLPMLHIPQTKGKKVLSMHGNFIVSEILIKNKENLRRMQIPLVKVLKDTTSEEFYSLCIDKSLSTVKLYSDMKFNILSLDPARFIWGQSYQFGIQQVMLNFDQFSKPPVDPSAKLGFWDKLRLVFHGHFNVTSDSRSGLEIAFKGSRDPYNLFGDGCGFVLAFKDDLDWKINKDDDPRHFFEVHSKKVSWYIPNYLKAPLPAWNREDARSIYLADSPEFITSCFAYNLQESRPLRASQKTNIIEKDVVRLSGGIDFKVGFMLERKDKNGEKTSECKPHYEINLFNPEYTKEGHDSYAGFRSSYVHMAIGLEANSKNSTNAIYLTPNTFQQFFRWWKLFQGNMMLPIRKGRMFGELKESVKFSQHLMTNKFQFHIKSLFITHVYHNNPEMDDEMILCVGLKAKVDEFVVDLHLRKELRTIVHEELSRNQKTMKMNFNIGEVHLNGIDLRLLDGMFEYQLYPASRERDNAIKFASFDKDQSWLDSRDFEEVHSAELHNGEVTVYPLLYSKRFTYLRDTMDDGDENEFGNEDIHECYLDKLDQLSPAEDLLRERVDDLKDQVSRNKSSHLKDRIEFIHSLGRGRSFSVSKTSIGTNKAKEKFHNRFALVGMFLKWNVDSRNNFMKYLHYSLLKGQMMKYLSYEAISTLEDLQKEAEQLLNGEGLSATSSAESKNLRNVISQRAKLALTEDQSAESRLDSYSSILKACGENEMISEDFKIEIVSPQIQLLTEADPDSIVLVTAPKIDMKVVSVIEDGSGKHLVNPKVYLYRYGILLHEANFFVIDKKDAQVPNELALGSKAYGSRTNWPPWLGIEICQEGRLAGTKKLLIEKMSLMVMYDQIKFLGKSRSQGDQSDEYGDDKKENEASSFSGDNLTIDIPQVVITSTSKQYFSLYLIVMGLFFYTEPMNKSLTERLEKLKFSIDFQDLGSIHTRLTQLHDYYQLMKVLLRNYEFRQDTMSNDMLNEALTIVAKREEVSSEVNSMMQILLSGDFKTSNLHSRAKAEWLIKTDQIILHMLEDDGSPLLDLAMANSNYRRLIFEDGSNLNNIVIEMMQGFNLIKNAPYPAFIEPLEDTSKEKQLLVNVKWKMNRPIGGIRIMEQFEISSQPLKVNLDERTGNKLMKYIFQSDFSNLKLSPLLQRKKSAKDAGENVTKELEDDTGEKSDDLSGKTDSTQSEASTSDKSKGRNVHLLKSSRSQYEFQDQVDDMVLRSKQYLSIVDFKLNSFRALISLKYKTGVMWLLNVQNFVVSFPEVVIQRRIMSLLDITMMVKRIVIRSLIKHLGGLIENRITAKNRSKRMIKAPLQPIKKYGRFMRVSELYLDSNEPTDT